MASDFRPSGVLVPLVTPFDAAGKVDRACLEGLASTFIHGGLNYGQIVTPA